MSPKSSRRIGAAFVKAAYLVVAQKFGEERADSLLEAGWLNFSDVEDETQSVPWSAAKPVLEQYAEAMSTEAAIVLARKLADDALLGHWGATMRTAKTFAEAHGSTPTGLLPREEAPFRFGALEVNGTSIRAKIESTKEGAASAPAPMLAAAELGALALLFGEELAAVLVRDDARIEIAWSAPSNPKPLFFAGAALGTLGGLIFASSLFGTSRPLALPLVLLVAAAVFVLLGYRTSRRERGRAIRADAGRRRVLERVMSLKDQESQSQIAGSAEGRVLAGRFRIDRRLAAGATGIVYRGRRIEDGRPVAIKLLRAAAVHDHAASARLRREAEALGLAWHPNVVEVIDHGVLPEGTSYLVMELLEGESYADFLANRGPILPTDLLPLAVQMAGALVAIHAAGIVHRDLKPANIFLVGAERSRVKLIDFGIARVEWEEMRITALGAPLGTPGYMSPEQSMGKEVDARTDLYSLGAILYESLLGDAPPAAPAGGAPTVDAVIEERIADLSERWQEILRRSLAPVEERFPSSKHMFEALRAMQAQPSVVLEAKGET